MTLSEELSWRGFVNQTTYPDSTALNGDPITFYWGVDPSADSMTIGNLAVAMMVRHFMTHGHKAILLVGGATGLIGDPDGKSQERSLKSLEEIERNTQAIAAQYTKVFDGLDFEIVNNYDWFKGVGYLNFLRDVGKHVPMRQMLGRDFVQNRLGSDGSGISYAEFSYSLIQGYDFLHLHRDKAVSLQVCGADQWGNSITGVDLIRRITGAEAHVWSAPLVVNKATGVKFGKSEDGAVWLDSDKTSVYQFYQFWLNVDDEGVEDYLKIYTMLNQADVTAIMAEFQSAPGGRSAQKRLAEAVTSLVHGEAAMNQARHVTQILFESGAYDRLSAAELQLISGEFTSLAYQQADQGSNLPKYLEQTGLAASLSEARRLLQSKAIYINGRQIDDTKQDFDEIDFLQGGYAILRRGKNRFAVITRE